MDSDCEDSFPIGVQRSVGETVEQANSDVLLVQHFNKPVDLFHPDVSPKALDGESFANVVNTLSMPPSDQSTHFGIEEKSSHFQESQQLVPNTFKGGGSSEMVPGEDSVDNPQTPQATADLVETVKHLDLRVERLERVEKDRGRITSPTTSDPPSPTQPGVFESLQGTHPYGQVQDSPILFSPNTSFSAQPWPKEE